MNLLKLFFLLSFLPLKLGAQVERNWPSQAKFSGVYFCEESNSKIKGEIVIYSEVLLDTDEIFKVRLDFEELIGSEYYIIGLLLKKPFICMYEIDNKVFVESDSAVISQNIPFIPMVPTLLMDLSAPIQTSWTCENVFFRNKATIRLVSKEFNHELNDLVYLFTIDGDKPTTHHDYLTSFAYTKRYGIIELTYRYSNDCYSRFSPR